MEDSSSSSSPNSANWWNRRSVDLQKKSTQLHSTTEYTFWGCHKSPGTWQGNGSLRCRFCDHACETPPEGTQHFLFECPALSTQRETMRDTIGEDNLKLNKIFHKENKLGMINFVRSTVGVRAPQITDAVCNLAEMECCSSGDSISSLNSSIYSFENIQNK